VGTVKVLVDQSLRPGVDLTREQAEQALSQTQLARAEQARSVAIAQLAEALGDPAVPVEPMAGSILSLPPPPPAPAETPRDPRRREGDAATRAATERKRAVQLQYLPASSWSVPCGRGAAACPTTRKATVSRVAHSIEARTRTMAVERDGRRSGGVFGPLASGDLLWRRGSEELPPGARVNTRLYHPEGGAHP
jgi:hypothetical protein